MLANASAPVVKKLSRALLNKKGEGTGNYLGYSMDDVVRIRVAKELLKVGVQVASIHGLFESIEKDWPRIRRLEAIRDGACLVLIIGALGPNRDSGGQVYLTTAHEAREWLRQTKRTVVVIDIGAIVEDIEQKTGRQYREDTAEDPSGGAAQ
ncbi:MAG TPA: hypothetical protein VNJ02_13350 [Vicinamibacterales bacterium]|nr:hypothetical protein [Vicinamibacterales bacterium]